MSSGGRGLAGAEEHDQWQQHMLWQGEKSMKFARAQLGLSREEGPSGRVVFLCVKVEFEEREPYKMTQVGVGLLDMKNTEGVMPGPYGIHWRPFVAAFHYRVDDDGDWLGVNWDGNEDKFDFG